MKRSEVEAAIKKMSKTKIEDDDGNKVFMITNVPDCSSLDYDEIKETYFGFLEKFMDEYGEEKVPEEFAEMYNALTDDSDVEIEEETAEMAPKAETSGYMQVMEESKTEATPEKKKRHRRTKAEIERDKAQAQGKTQEKEQKERERVIPSQVDIPFDYSLGEKEVEKSTPQVESDPRDVAGERTSKPEDATIVPVLSEIQLGPIKVLVSGSIEIKVKVEK